MANHPSRRIRLLLAAAFLGMAILLSWALSHRVGLIPPLGHLLNPFHGFWQNMEGEGIADLILDDKNLQSTVTVRYDERGVPHIFARNDYDLYFAQGLVTARDRLWQIDFQIRAAAGRLAEIIGPDAISYDRAQRRKGMTYGAEIQAAEMTADPRTATMVQAYADGYNAWLEQLRPSEYPVEFKILDYAPEPMTPLGTALMIMNMSQTLTAGTRAHAQTNARALMDPDTYHLLYPDMLPWTDPIIPPDRTWNFDPLTPKTPDPDFIPRIVRDLPYADHHPEIGSNSWAVDGSKTAGGHPILANDPHLSVTLPSIWYEVQLHSQGINTYGASIPGAPGVVIGFNEDVAWGVTNTGSHLLDVYEITFRDDRRTEYLHDGEWKPVRQRIESIPVRGGEAFTDTVRYTHHGPVTQPFDEEVASRNFPEGHAIRWIAHEPGHNVMLSIYKYNRARNQEEFESALRHFTILPQNMTYADRHGNISIGHIGLFPVRFRGQGGYISDGSDPAYDWDRFIPFEHLPRSFNPGRGYVSSANQAPVTTDYPYYLGRHYAGYSRGARINQILESADSITVDFFEDMQLDTHSLPAGRILPFLLSRLDEDASESTLARLLGEWNHTFDAGSPIALFYTNWRDQLLQLLWGPLLDSFGDVYVQRPATSTTIRLLLDGEHHVFPVDVAEAVNRSFHESAERFTRRYGNDPDGWRYGRDRNAQIGHLAMLPGFGEYELDASGTPEAINATGSHHAPSWRMIVKLGPEVRARGHFPGGQTGNPGHPDYARFVRDWSDGRFYNLHFLRDPGDEPERTASTLRLQPSGR